MSLALSLIAGAIHAATLTTLVTFNGVNGAHPALMP
jgi:hypothetical protein